METLLGLGKLAAVFEASHVNGNRVALKVLHSDLANSPELRERFLTEAYAANRVAHPGVMAVRDEGTTDDGLVFLVFELLRGQSLARRLELQGAPFSPRDVLELGAQLLDVLVHAHHRGFVHGDIRPENVFQTRDGRVRLLNFAVSESTSKRSRADGPGATARLPAFAPPNQTLGNWDAVNARSDLSSLGASMFLLLAGRPVRNGVSVAEQLRSGGESAALPRSVVAVLDRALAFDSEDHFPDARSMRLAVQAATDELSPRSVPPPPSVAPLTLSVQPPRPRSVSTLRPVVSSSGLNPVGGRVESRGTLGLFVGLGMALGLGIVVAARLTTHVPEAPVGPVAAGEALQPEPPRPSLDARGPAARVTPSSRPPAPLPPGSATPENTKKLRAVKPQVAGIPRSD